MSDLNYQISVQLKQGVENLRKFRKAADSFDKGREAALKRQIDLLEKMKKLQEGLNKPTKVPPTSPTPKPRTVRQSRPSTWLPEGQTDDKAFKKYYQDLQKESDKKLKAEEVAYTKTQEALTKRLEREEKERTRIAVGQVKARMKAEQEARRISNARIKQAVGGLTSPSGAEGMRDYYRKLEKESLRDANAKTKELNKQAKAEAQRLSSLEKTRATIMNSALMTEKEANAAHRTAQENIRARLAKAKTSAEMRKIVAQERASLRLAKKKSFLVSRMEASSKEFAGNMVSAFAVAAGGVFITRTGQEFQGLSNLMLTVSEDAQDAADNLAWAKEQAIRLGLDFEVVGSAYAKLLSGGEGEMSKSEIQETLLGIAEAGTVLNLSLEANKRVFTGMTQMMGRGQVMAQELKEQIGEVIPDAITHMAKAAQDAGISISGTRSELADLMEDGKVFTKDVLPFFNKRIREAYAPGLEEALKSNKNAMNSLVAAAKIAANEIFTSGWGEGLTVLFNSLAEMIKENETLFTEFGKTMGKVFKGLAWVVENVLDPVFSALGSILHGVNSAMETFGDWVAAALIPLARYSPILGRIIKYFGGLRAVMGVVAKIAVRMLGYFYLGLGVLEEIAEFFSPTGKNTLIGFNINDIANPFESWREEIDYIWDKMMAIGKIFGIGSTQDIGTTRGVLPYNHEAFMQPRQQSVFQPSQAPIHVTVDIDGNKVAEAVATKPAMAESMNRAMNKAFDPNYR